VADPPVAPVVAMAWTVQAGEPALAFGVLACRSSFGDETPKAVVVPKFWALIPGLAAALRPR
jgi:hypothetical protein